MPCSNQEYVFSKSEVVAIPDDTLVNAYQNVVASTTILTVPGHLPSFVNVESTSIGVVSPPSSRPELALSCSSSFISSNSHGGDADCRGNVPDAAMVD